MPKDKRVMIDCRQHPGSDCSVTISGTEEEVMSLAVYHGKTRHGMKDDDKTRAELRSMLKEEALSR